MKHIAETVLQATRRILFPLMLAVLLATRVTAGPLSAVPLSIGGPVLSPWSGQVVTLGSYAYFAAETPGAGYKGIELYRFDGDSISLAADIYPGLQSSLPRNFARYGDAIYFQATDATEGAELWKYDGAAATRVRTFGPSTTGGDPDEFVVWNNRLFFTVSPSGGGGASRNLWQYDGTNFFPVGASISSLHTGTMAAGHDGLYRTLYEASRGYELYKYDGANSTPATETIPGTNSVYPRRMAALDDELLMVVSGPSSTNELWALHNGQMRTVATGFIDSRLLPVGQVGDDLFYIGTLVGQPTALWKYDGQTLSHLHNFRENSPSSLQAAFATDSQLFFSINDDTHGTELWVYDGVSTYLVEDIDPGSASSVPHGFFELNDRVHFFAGGGEVPLQIWAVVPEPTSIGLLAFGGLALVAWSRRGRRKA